MATIILAVIFLAALYVQDRLAHRHLQEAVALERARQDLLLDRLASRSPAEFHALREVVEPPAPDQVVDQLRHLYDPTGLVHDVEAVSSDG